METVLSFLPPELWVKYSAMTGQSLYYLGEYDLKHKILAVVEEAGAEKAGYPLKLLQSEGELCIASTGKDPLTGRLITHEYRLEGPVSILITTTTLDIDEELQNRCLVLTVNEDRDQTRAIHRLQRDGETLAGYRNRRETARLRTLHYNVHRLLQPLAVINPFAPLLTFIDTATRTRRDHLKYLTLIKTIALLHQYQRPIHKDRFGGQYHRYIEVTADDIALANRLTGEILGRSLDELPPQTRRLLDLIGDMVRDACRSQGIDQADYRFTRKEVRECTGWGDTQLKVHLARLVDLDYLIVHGGFRTRRYHYELLYRGEGKEQERFLLGLIDVNTLPARENVSTI